MRIFVSIFLSVAAFLTGIFSASAVEAWHISRGANLIAEKAVAKGLRVNLRLRDPANTKNSDNWLQLARPLSPEEGKHRFVTLQWRSTQPGTQ